MPDEPEGAICFQRQMSLKEGIRAEPPGDCQSDLDFLRVGNRWLAVGVGSFSRPRVISRNRNGSRSLGIWTRYRQPGVGSEPASIQADLVFGPYGIGLIDPIGDGFQRRLDR